MKATYFLIFAIFSFFPRAVDGKRFPGVGCEYADAVFTFNDGSSTHATVHSEFGDWSQAIAAPAVIADPFDACNAITNDLTGKVAVVQRSVAGGCFFSTKARNAQNAGAVAVLILNNGRIDIDRVYCGDSSCADITIPVLFVYNQNAEEFEGAVRNDPGHMVHLGCKINDHLLPEREPMEMLAGKVLTEIEGLAFIEIWDGKIFNLVGLTREDVSSLVTEVRASQFGSGWVLFEGYRRGTAFEVVSWDSFPLGTPFAEEPEYPTIFEGEHTALVVRLTVKGNEPKTTQDQIRSEVFNNNGGDQWNMNLFERCSYGTYKIIPFAGQYAGQFDISGGVMDFEIDEVPPNLKIKDFEEEYYWLGHVASIKFPYDESVDFILFVLPEGLADWGPTRAYAKRPGRISVYDDEAILNPFVVGHEIGHNLGLRHSADVANPKTEYGDHTCLMGNGYVKDDLERDFDESTHCFNNAKNWQLGWFGDRRAQWSPSDGLKTFDLVGLGDYSFTNDKQIIALETESNGVKCYLGFNRVSGINKDIKEYEDLVTVQCVDDQLSYLLAHLDSGDWRADLKVVIEREEKDALEFHLDYTIYVEAIEIKPEGQASYARIILGSKTEVIQDNEANNRPMNCIVDATKSAPTCTDECGSVPAVPHDDYPAFNGGSCEYECGMYEGLCVVGGKCTDAVLGDFYTELEKYFAEHSLTYNETDYMCTNVQQIPYHLLSNFTCFQPDLREIMLSEYHSFCNYDFTSKAEVDVEKQITIVLNYSVQEERSWNKSSAQLSIAQNFAELIGEDLVVVNIDEVALIIEVTFATKYHGDLEDRVKHKWFLHRLREKLSTTDIQFDLDVDYTEEETQNDDDAVQILDDKTMIIGAASGVFVFLIIASISIYCKCRGSQKQNTYDVNV